VVADKRSTIRIGSAAGGGRAIECAVRSGDQATVEIGAVAAGESVEYGFGPGSARRRRREFEDDAAPNAVTGSAAAILRSTVDGSLSAEQRRATYGKRTMVFRVQPS
jgi:hypothetical protein